MDWIWDIVTYNLLYECVLTFLALWNVAVSKCVDLRIYKNVGIKLNLNEER